MTEMLKYLFLFTLSLSFVEVTSQVFVNEIMARNNYTYEDEFGEFDDWIEIYNPTNEAIDLAGGYVTDDLSNTTAHLIESGSPELTTVPANGYLIFWADGSPEQGANHLSFSLSAGGESVALVLSDGEFVVDALQFSDQENDISFGRETDGSIALQFFTQPTPNATNLDVIIPSADLKLNEAQSENTTTIFDETGVYEPWLEIYNPLDVQVNLAGYSLNFNDGESVYEIENTDPNSSVIESDNHKLFWCDGQSVEGLLHTNFILTNSCNIKLYGPDGALVDELNFASPGLNQSIGSDQDGSDNLVSFSVATPDVTNDLILDLPELLYINEIMASNVADTTDNFGEFEDWIEIYNPNNFEVDLSGYHISDTYGGGSWEVPSIYPDSVTVPAQGFLIFWADNDEEQGVRHTDFKLTSSGEDVILLGRDDFSQADFIQYPVQSEDVSWGREIDGNNEWVYFIPENTTPEYSNHGAVNVEELTLKDFLVYPNPASSEVRFSEKVNSAKILTLEGKEVLSCKNCKSMNTSELSSGFYSLTLNGIKTVKLILE